MSCNKILKLETLAGVEGVYTEKVGARYSNAILSSVLLRTETDHHDTPVSERVSYAYRGRIERVEGHFFFLSLPAEGLSVVYIVPTPDLITPTLSMEKGEVRICCGDYAVVRGECKTGDEAYLCRSWYRTLYKPSMLVAMSNTWGDRGGREVVTEEFVLGEIEWAKRLGVDVVQVDDGWQKQAPNTYDETGLRVFEGDFWDVQTSVFPNGIESITPYATAHGVETGLWFAPHSRNDFEHFDRDVALLRHAYEEWGFRYFKLDMLQLHSVSQCKRAEEFFKALLAFGDDVTVELDVTADKRLGYLASAPYGTLFVENRYSAWSNYYPHATLRNLWRLSELVPASKLQFELLNPKRFTEAYAKEDVLRPETYGIDYFFASVMVSNPLFWMEMQHLSEEDAERLASIVGVWRAWRGELVRADVCPILEEPSGASLTGFTAKTEDALHVILLREVTEREDFAFEVEGYTSPTLLATNANAAVSLTDEALRVRLDAPRSYAWIRLEKK